MPMLRFAIGLPIQEFGDLSRKQFVNLRFFNILRIPELLLLCVLFSFFHMSNVE